MCQRGIQLFAFQYFDFLILNIISLKFIQHGNLLFPHGIKWNVS